MPFDSVIRLRNLIGERIPPDGAETDTLFTDAEIEDFLLQASGSLTQAAYIGWQTKAGIYAGLVSTTEGNASRLNSDLHAHAMTMVRHFQGRLPSNIAGRTRVGRITRPGTGAV